MKKIIFILLFICPTGSGFASSSGSATGSGFASGYGSATGWNSSSSSATQRIKIAFYNVENLFDTIPNPATADDDFTPRGSYLWNSKKYLAKIENIARVIDDIGADIIGLAEVENEAVIQDLLRAMESDYNYVLLPSKDLRGITQALLYRGSILFTERTRQVWGEGLVRQPLVVEGELADGTKCVFIVCHLPSKLSNANYRKKAAESLSAEIERISTTSPDAKIVVMGDFNFTPNSTNAKIITNRASLFSPLQELSKSGYGSYVYNQRRYMYDFFLLSQNWLPKNRQSSEDNQSTPFLYSNDCGIFVDNYMIGTEGTNRGSPLRSGNGRGSVVGFSDHLPVYIVIER